MTGRTIEDNKMKTELKGIHLFWQQQVKIYYWKIKKKNVHRENIAFLKAETVF